MDPYSDNNLYRPLSQTPRRTHTEVHAMLVSRVTLTRADETYCSALGAVVIASSVRTHIWLLCLRVDASVLESDHTIANLVRVKVSGSSERGHR